MQDAVYLSLYNKHFENCFYMAWKKREVDQGEKQQQQKKTGEIFLV